jgi:hypothetical protein
MSIQATMLAGGGKRSVGSLVRILTILSFPSVRFRKSIPSRCHDDSE